MTFLKTEIGSHTIYLDRLSENTWIIFDGCLVLTFARDEGNAIKLYKNQLKRFRNRYTRELKHTIRHIKENIDCVNMELVYKHVGKDFNLTKEQIDELLKQEEPK